MKRVLLVILALTLGGELAGEPAMLWAQASRPTTAGASRPAQGMRTPAPATTRASTDASAGLAWMDNAFGKARDCQLRLELLRHAGSPKGQAVEPLLATGLAALEPVQEFLKAPAEAAASQPAKAAADDPQARFLRARRCQMELARGRLYLAAGLAMAGEEPDAHPATMATTAPSGWAPVDYLAKSSEIFRALRLEYRDLPLGMLGYIEEARGQRLSGNGQAALHTLQTVLALTAKPADKAGLELHRAAMLEQMEAQLVLDPALAAKATAEWQQKELRSDPAWKGRADWVLARAYLAQAASAKDANTRADLSAKALELLRNEALAQQADAFERLEALVRLEAISGGQILTPAERLDWAGALAGVHRPEAMAAYERALAMPGQAASARQTLNYVALLIQREDWPKAVAQCDALLAKLSAQDDGYNQVLQLRATALLKLAAASGADAAGREKLLSALEAVFQSNMDEPIRREALVQWVWAADLSAAPRKVLQTLSVQEPLVQGSPYLLYCRAAAMWALRDAKDALAPAAEEILQQVQAAQDAASKAQDSALLGRAILLHARVVAGPMKDARAAYALLEKNAPALQADAALAQDVLALRIELLLDLNLVDEASKLLAGSSGDKSAATADAALRLCEALADRFAASAGPEQDAIRREVLALTGQAMAASLSQKETYVRVAQRSAPLLLKVRAHSDLQRLLGDLRTNPLIQQNPRESLACTLWLGQSLLESGQAAGALAVLDEAAGSAKAAPDAIALHTARGNCLLALRKNDRAADAFREVRKLARPGTPAWCQATLDLAGALQAQRNTAAARDILRVAGSLYPDFGNQELHARWVQLQETLR